MAYTTTTLLADVRRAAMLPDTSNTGTADADLLAAGDKEMQGRLVPLVMKAREEYFVRSLDYTITANQAAYRVPPRAIGGKLRDAFVVQSSSLQALARLEPERLPEFSTVASVPWAFYMEGNSLVLVPTPASTANTLRVKYFVRPNRLIATTAARQITSVTAATPSALYTRIGLASSVPGGWTSSLTYDVVKATPGFEHAAIDLIPTGGLSGSNFDTLTSALPSGFGSSNVGDWVCLAEESPIPQLPAELHQLLGQRIACRVLQALGDLEALKSAERDAERMEGEALSLIQPRTDGTPRKLVPNLLSRRRGGYGVGW